MESKIFAFLGFDPGIIIIIMLLMIIVLFLLIMNVNLKYGRLKASYNSFMKGKDGKTLENSFKEKFDEYLDKDSTINYFIMLEFASLSDNVAKNMLLATYDGKVWYPTLYDLDSSWGTKYDGLSTLNYEDYTGFEYMELWNKLQKNFSKEIAERYFELREDILTKENIMKKFNDFKNSIPQETYKKEQKRWKNIPGYDISQIEEFLEIRIPLIDKIMKERLN